jgi:RNA polymerase sigma factor for flagellar operon FliA
LESFRRGVMEKEGTLETDLEPEAALWDDYRRSRDPQVRHRLVRRYLGMTQRIAASLFGRRIGNSASFDDYLQCARVGLLEAIDRYDPTREASFATFAGYRIRGSVLNGLEQSSESAAQAAHRRHARLRERAQSLASAAGGSAGSLHRGLATQGHADRFAGMVDVTILLAMGYVLEDNGDWNPAGAETNDPYRSLELERVRARLNQLVDVLPERERWIVRYHYFQHMEFQEIGELLEVSKGRVSQLHARALQLIREGYEALEEFDLQL